MPTAFAQLNIITDGEEINREFRLTEAPFSIGSAADNSLVIKDPSILEHHAEILWQTGPLFHYFLSRKGQDFDQW